MGLVEQLAGFSSDVAAAKGPLRPLLCSRNPYIWTADHEMAFEAVKAALEHDGGVAVAELVLRKSGARALEPQRNDCLFHA